MIKFKTIILLQNVGLAWLKNENSKKGTAEESTIKISVTEIRNNTHFIFILLTTVILARDYNFLILATGILARDYNFLLLTTVYLLEIIISFYSLQYTC